MTYRLIWAFDADPAQVAAFEEAYAADGAWVELFREGRGFVRTELFRSVADPARFLTVDTWESQSDYEAFHRRHAEPYAALDARCEGLTRREELVAGIEAG
jgi:heme-degrading monooxygenase HmoA